MENAWSHPLPFLTSPHTPLFMWKSSTKNEPLIQLKPIKLTSYPFGQRATLLKPYSQYDEIWAPANHLTNNFDGIIPSSSESPDTSIPSTLEHDLVPSNEDIGMTPNPDLELVRSSEDVVMNPNRDHKRGQSYEVHDHVLSWHLKIQYSLLHKRSRRKES